MVLSLSLSPPSPSIPLSLSRAHTPFHSLPRTGGIRRLLRCLRYMHYIILLCYILHYIIIPHVSTQVGYGDFFAVSVYYIMLYYIILYNLYLIPHVSTQVGYGDFFAVSVAGKLLAVVMILGSLATISEQATQYHIMLFYIIIFYYMCSLSV
jgi:hypothetical protein